MKSSHPDMNLWIKQVRGLNLAMELFQEKPTKARKDTLIAEIEAYLHAANIGAMTVPNIHRSAM